MTCCMYKHTIFRCYIKIILAIFERIKRKFFHRLTLVVIIMSESTLTLVIAGISAFATVSAAVIYYYTLSELKKQRQNTYKPQLFLDSTYFTVQGIKCNDFLMPLKWDEEMNKNLTIANFDNKNGIAKYELKCYNVGFGTATNIETHFNFDLNKFIKEINNLQIDIEENLKVEIKNKGGFISFNTIYKDLPFTNKSISIKNSLDNYISYALPISINNDAVLISVPSHFLELLNLYVFYFSKRNDAKKEINIPEILVQMKFKDISETKYSQKIRIKTELESLSIAGYTGQFKINKL